MPVVVVVLFLAMGGMEAVKALFLVLESAVAIFLFFLLVILVSLCFNVEFYRPEISIINAIVGI